MGQTVPSVCLEVVDARAQLGWEVGEGDGSHKVHRRLVVFAGLLGLPQQYKIGLVEFLFGMRGAWDDFIYFIMAFKTGLGRVGLLVAFVGGFPGSASFVGDLRPDDFAGGLNKYNRYHSLVFLFDVREEGRVAQVWLAAGAYVRTLFWLLLWTFVHRLKLIISPKIILELIHQK